MERHLGHQIRAGSPACTIVHGIGDEFDQVIRRFGRAKHLETILRVTDGDLRRCPRVVRKTFEFPPDEPKVAARYWRDKVTKLEQQVAELKAALAREKAFEAGEPVASIVRARKPKPRW